MDVFLFRISNSDSIGITDNEENGEDGDVFEEPNTTEKKTDDSYLKKKLNFKMNENSVPKLTSRTSLSDMTSDRFREIVLKRIHNRRISVSIRNKEKSVIIILVFITTMITIVNIPSAFVYMLMYFEEYSSKTSFQVI